MPKRSVTGSESEATSETSSSEEAENPSEGNNQVALEYEKQRLSRIAENKKRLEALGLVKIASSLRGSVKRVSQNKKGKGKVGVEDDDEDYSPDEAEESSGSSGAEDMDTSDEDYEGPKASRSGGRKVKSKGLKSTKKDSSKKISNSLPHIDDADDDDDDDDALRHAIALSLQQTVETSDKVMLNTPQKERKKKGNAEDDKEKAKRKKSVSSRMQMTEDELLMHFYQFDESWKGSITVNDIRRVATAHDFTWSDKELGYMIQLFDSDGDGKLSLDDFRRIVNRCNMIKVPGSP